jgi:hypothetical protein
MTPFERMLESTLYVAADRARRERRHMAVELGPVAWTVREARLPPPPDHERITVIGPEDDEETIMGVAKRVYLARVQGQPIARAVLRLLDTDPTAAPASLAGDTLPGAVNAHDLASQFGQPQPTAYTGPPVMETNLGPIHVGTLVVALPGEPPAPPEYCTLCGGPAEPCVSLCVKALTIDDPANSVRGTQPKATQPPTTASAASVPQSGPYQPAGPPARQKRSQKAPAKDQGSLFD